ncbi:hypothetical protein BHE74_00010543 [Ensete ventricosum]|nr:hypothetical protein BHE74_00010543 [Ensete ventricosum]
MSPTGHDRMCCIAMNYSTMIRYTMSPHGDISIAYIFSCDELGLHLLHVWPMLTPRFGDHHPLWILYLAEQLVPCSVPANALVRLRPFVNTVPTAPFKLKSTTKQTKLGLSSLLQARYLLYKVLIAPAPDDVVHGIHAAAMLGRPYLLELCKLGYLAEGIRGMPRVRQKLAEGKSLLGVHRELAEGDQELARMASRAYRKKTKRLTGRSSGVTKKLTGSQVGLARLDGHIGEID